MDINLEITGKAQGSGGSVDPQFQNIDDAPEQESLEVVNEFEPKGDTKVLDYSLIDKLFAFLEKEKSRGFDEMGLNQTLCGYFCKVVQQVMKIQPKEFAKYVIQNDYTLFDHLLDFIDNQSICELFIKILTDMADYNANQ